MSRPGYSTHPLHPTRTPKPTDEYMSTFNLSCSLPLATSPRSRQSRRCWSKIASTPTSPSRRLGEWNYPLFAPPTPYRTHVPSSRPNPVLNGSKGRFSRKKNQWWGSYCCIERILEILKKNKCDPKTRDFLDESQGACRVLQDTTVDEQKTSTKNWQTRQHITQVALHLIVSMKQVISAQSVVTSKQMAHVPLTPFISPTKVS